MGKVKVIRIVVDTNVMISALLFGGEPGELVSLWKTQGIQGVACRDIIDEYLRVLAYPKFKLSPEEINYILHKEILPHFEIAVPKPGRIIIQDDLSDDKFLRCAKAAKATFILSGDKHLLGLKSYANIRILPVVRFLKELGKQEH